MVIHQEEETIYTAGLIMGEAGKAIRSSKYIWPPGRRKNKYIWPPNWVGQARPSGISKYIWPPERRNNESIWPPNGGGRKGCWEAVHTSGHHKEETINTSGLQMGEAGMASWKQ